MIACAHTSYGKMVDVKFFTRTAGQQFTAEINNVYSVVSLMTQNLNNLNG